MTLGALAMRGLTQHLGKGDESELGTDALPRMRHLRRSPGLKWRLLKRPDVRDPLPEGMFDLFDEHSLKLRQVASFHRVLRSWNDWPVVGASRLKAGIGGALAGAVQPYDRFHERPVRECLRIGTEAAHFPRHFERRGNFGFSRPGRISEHRVDVAIVQRLIDGFGDGSIERIAVSLRKLCTDQQRAGKDSGSDQHPDVRHLGCS